MQKKIIENINPNISLSLKNIDIIFNKGEQNEFKLLNNINYDFEKGKVHFIIGPSGSGKTVLINHFNGLSIPTNGSIYINGKLMEHKKGKIKNIKEIRRKIGMVFQFAEYQLFKSTIEKDIMFGPINFGVKKHIAKDRAKKYLSLVGMPEEFLKRNPFGLSGGQKRRVAIAGILAIEPDIIVFDEPTAGLDPRGEKEILEIITSLAKEGKTIIIVTHSVNNVLQFADNVIVLNNGSIAASGDLYDIYKDEELIKKTNLSIPFVFTMINKLVEHDKKYNILYEQFKPRTVEELAKCLYENHLVKGIK